jgi:hypothetical protein
MVGNTDPVSLTDAELAAEVARDTGEVLLAVVPRGDLPTNPTHRFELLAGTLRSQPTIRRCECIAGRPPALRGGHQRLDQLPLGVGQVGKIALVLGHKSTQAQNALACLNACSV